MENSRQNTRFRWRDAKKMESVIAKVDETAEALEILDPIVFDENVEFEGKIIDKTGAEVLALPLVPAAEGTYVLKATRDEAGDVELEFVLEE